MEINNSSPFKKKANQNKKEQLSDLESSSEDEGSDSEWASSRLNGVLDTPNSY